VTRPRRRRSREKLLGAKLLWKTENGAVLDFGGVMLVFESAEVPVFRTFLEAHGEGIQHIGVSVTNLDEAMKDAEAMGARLLNPNLDANGPRREVLVHPRSGLGVLWQMIEWNARLVNDQPARRAALRDGEIKVPGLR